MTVPAIVLGLLLVGGIAALAATVHRRVLRERDELEAALRSTERGLAGAVAQADGWQLALHTVTDGVVVTDAGGAVVFRNEPARRFVGGRHSDAVAEELIDRLLERALAGGDEVQELPLFGPPREVLLVRAVPLRLDGELVGAAAFVRDVTELRRVEAVRRDFVANVSHELKTPIGALGLLADTIAAADDPTELRRLSEQMAREADRLARIVEDLLDLSLIEAQEAPTRETVPVRSLVEESLARVRPLAVTRAIPLDVTAVADDLAVRCDPRQVVSALTNLLDNAVKYSEQGASVEVGASRANGRIAIEVRDHGIGIPARDLERIFERFYRVDRARSRATGGTGLGLSIVRHVALVHGGDVTVESVEGEGSTFTLLLPAGESADAHAPAEARQGFASQPEGTAPTEVAEAS